MKLKPSWFTEQLDLAAKEVSTWSEWERHEGGLTSPSAPTPASSLDGNKTSTMPSQSVQELASSSK
jgi:hypothetical protein